MRLAGAQIPLELVESWLGESKAMRFAVERVEPVAWSEAGFEHLEKCECDVACTDRLMTPREVHKYGPRDVRGWRVGFYGYAFYVNPANPTDSIFAGHIKLLLRRKITDWGEIGPFAGPIRLIGPEKATRGGEILMRQARLWIDKPTWEALPTDAAIVDAVAHDRSALGFASIGFDGPARYLGLRMERTAPPAWPSLEEIESEKYGLAKVIYVYVSSPPTPAARAVLDVLYGADAERAMRATGVWPIPRQRGAVTGP